MAPVRGTFAACVLAFAVPVAALLAQQPAKPLRPHRRTRGRFRRSCVRGPVPTGRSTYRPNQLQILAGFVYPTVSVVNRYVKPRPDPAPAKRKATPRPHNNGQDVFETHSSDDAK